MLLFLRVSCSDSGSSNVAGPTIEEYSIHDVSKSIFALQQLSNRSLMSDFAVTLRPKQARGEPGVAKAQKRNVQSRFWYLAVRSK